MAAGLARQLSKRSPRYANEACCEAAYAVAPPRLACSRRAPSEYTKRQTSRRSRVDNSNFDDICLEADVKLSRDTSCLETDLRGQMLIYDEASHGNGFSSPISVAVLYAAAQKSLEAEQSGAFTSQVKEHQDPLGNCSLSLTKFLRRLRK